MSSTPNRTIKRVRTHWTDVVLVCRKCSKKLGGGFGPEGRQSFQKALRRAMAGKDAPDGPARTKRAVGVIEVDCQDICPKGAVMALRAGQPEAWLAIPRGTNLDEVQNRLGLAPRLAETPDAMALSAASV